LLLRLDMSSAPSDNADAPLGGVQQDPNRVSMLVHGTSDQPASPEEDEVPVGSPHENIAAVVRPSAIVECEGNEDTGDGAASLAEEVAGQKQQAVDEAGNIEEEGDAQQGADDDGSEYSYEYCDSDADDDGFLIPAAAPAAVASTEEEVLEIARSVSRLESDTAASSSVPETNPKSALEKKQKWKEPTRAAVNMSLRAEKEKTGGRRRLASDLYKIMMADTKEAGFSLEPVDEDSMDKWRINLFGFDEDSNLAKDLMVCGTDSVELQMSFPDDYPFKPPFVRVVKPRFQRQTGFVMSGALCMELLTSDGWNPVNDIESVIVSIRSLMVVGNGRLQAAVDMGQDAYKKALAGILERKKEGKMAAAKSDGTEGSDDNKRKRSDSNADEDGEPKAEPKKSITGGSYTTGEAEEAYKYLSNYHKKEGWDRNGWWARKG